MNIEYEIKSTISNEDVNSILKNFPVLKEGHDVDIYFDNVDGYFFKKGVFIRIRNNDVFEIKYNSDLLDTSHTSCREYKYGMILTGKEGDQLVGFFDSLGWNTPKNELPINTISFLKNLGLDTFVTINKNRKLVDIGQEGIECFIDDVEDLGQFIVLEAQSKNGLEKIKLLLEQYKLSNIPVGYVELFLRMHRRDLYLKGRYIIDEDL